MSRDGWGWVYVKADRLGWHPLGAGNTIEQETHWLRQKGLIIDLGPRMLGYLKEVGGGELYCVYIHKSLLK